MTLSEINKINLTTIYKNIYSQSNIQTTIDSNQKLTLPSAGQRRLRTEIGLFNFQNNLSPEALDALVKYGNNKEGYSALNYAIEFVHDWKAVDALIEAGLGINSKDGHVGNTPILRLLSLAANYGPDYAVNAKSALRKLIQKGIDPSLPMGNGFNQGQFCLYETACFYQGKLNSELDLFLTKYNIDLNLKSGYRKPIQHVIQFSDLEPIKILMKHGARINDIDCFNNFHLTSTAQQVKERIQFLINLGANPLIVASSDPKISAIDQVLKRVLAIPNDNGCDAFKRELIPYLLSLGAKMS